MIKSKKIISCLLIIVMFSSCEKKFDYNDYDVTLANLFSVYGDNMEDDIIFLNKKISVKKSQLPASKNDTLKNIDFIVTSYYNYLNEADLKSQKLMKNLFYDKDVLSEDGKVFKKNSETFFTDLDVLLKDKDIKDYLHHYFNVDDVKNNQNQYFLFMEYHYLGIPYPTFRFLIKKRKYELLVFQNELLNSYLHK